MEMPEINQDVQHVLDTYSPGDIASLGDVLAPLAMLKFLRLQLHPYLPYSGTDARWIIQAFRTVEASIPPAKRGFRDWF